MSGSAEVVVGERELSDGIKKVAEIGKVVESAMPRALAQFLKSPVPSIASMML